ncbi:DUF1080 domain-containing protein, partial [bacterium]|nr:DUF1080 domain-containing protein [bacterium]
MQDPDGRAHPLGKGDSWLFTNEEWDDFSLSLGFRIRNGETLGEGNSGIGFRMPAGVEGRPSKYGFEMQINRDDTTYPTGSIYNHVPVDTLYHNSGWNQVNITCVGEHIVVYLNRESVIDADLPGSRQGRIGFQVHGGLDFQNEVVEFKHIHVKDLKMQYQAEPAPFDFSISPLSDLPAEGCAVTDINNDGQLDITSGPFWYEAPNWVPHRYRNVAQLGATIDSYNEIPMDVNQDGWMDIISGGWYASKIQWFENPGTFKEESIWQAHTIADSLLRVETITAVDLSGDGYLDILPSRLDKNAPLGYYAYVGLSQSETGFAYRQIDTAFRGFGNGYGDVDRDGRIDLLTPTGWYKAPQDAAQGEWLFHPYPALPTTNVPLQVEDFNNDGRADILYGSAHGFGLGWMQQTDSGWQLHSIDDTISQLQSAKLADMDGDGTKDIVTGKRYLAGNGFDPGFAEPLALFWYQVEKGTKPVFSKHIITYDQPIGTGLNLRMADIDQDGDMDILAAGKTGLYLLKSNRIDASAIINWTIY